MCLQTIVLSYFIICFGCDISILPTNHDKLNIYTDNYVVMYAVYQTVYLLIKYVILLHFCLRFLTIMQ